MKLPLEKYGGDPDEVVVSWVLLEGNTAEQADGATIGAVATTGVKRSGGGTIAHRAFLYGAPRVWAEIYIFCAQNTDETATRL